MLKIDKPGSIVDDGMAKLDLLFGVVSFGSDVCGESVKPGVYTDVGFFAEWIEDVISDKVSREVSFA